jgi:hypothetical protein
LILQDDIEGEGSQKYYIQQIAIDKDGFSVNDIGLTSIEHIKNIESYQEELALSIKTLPKFNDGDKFQYKRVKK